MYTQAVLDNRRMYEADRLASAAGVPGVTLMENAGAAIAQEIQRRWTPRQVCVLCGPGNNGGDGFVVARLLAQAGWPVRLGLICAREQLRGDAAHHAVQWQGKAEPLSPALLEGAELVVDALFGAGLTRPLEGAAKAMLEEIASRAVPVIAIDVPSGVMGDTGEAFGAIQAALTVTFFCKKPAHLLHPGRKLCGEIVVADIGIPERALEELHPDIFENGPQYWLPHFPHPQVEDHKYTRGAALVYGGYPMTGAARLAAHAAARTGAGLVTVVCPQEAFSIYAETLTSILVRPLAAEEGFSAVLKDKRFTAALLGPGAGVTDKMRHEVLTVLESGVATVLDADALTLFEGRHENLRHAIKHPCVMTPHEGEFKRICDIQGDKLTRARAAAKAYGAVIVLKGSDTVIAAPDGRVVINSNAPAELATAGAGDVLAGMVLGLLAQGMDAFFAAAAAVWLHGAAASEFGPGLIAEDIADMLPQVYRSLK
ncbi:MAG TPA: NAD(P)H-hydrate dehydratase [Rickettsiales bacterium]|nr:NAD(P)H-hydrate dehydratase [Rickettsiales bacterium]